MTFASSSNAAAPARKYEQHCEAALWVRSRLSEFSISELPLLLVEGCWLRDRGCIGDGSHSWRMSKRSDRIAGCELYKGQCIPLQCELYKALHSVLEQACS